ncbi:MAG: SPFH domain-containing protein [Bacteroidota bacterium]
MNTLILGSCTIVRPGQVGVRQRLGTLSNQTHDQGIVWYWPIVSKVIKTNVQVQDIELSISLPSKEGLSVTSQISILFKINQNKVPALIRNIGFGYQPIISNVFRSASADVCAQYFAKDMHWACALKLKKLSKSK